MEKIVLDQEKISKDIIGLSYEETIEYFNKFMKTKYYFRPIKIDDINLWKDNEQDILRCNVTFVTNKVTKIDGWY